MHPLELLNEAELGSLARVVDRLLNTRHLLTPGQRTNRLRPGFGVEFLDHREYSPGDDIRDVDWRTSARSRHPQIRRYSDEAASDWFILLDCSSSMAFGRNRKWSLAVQCAAAMAYLLIHMGNRVSVLVFSDKIERMIPLGRGYSHYASILRGLRQTTPVDSGNATSLRCCVSTIKRNCPVFVISDFLAADNLQDDLNALSMRSDRLHSMQILSSHDNELPRGQSVRFKDVETGATLTADISAPRRIEYLQAFENFKNSLSAYCRNNRIHFSRHADDESWKSVLVEHLKYGARLA
jgi:uncharacterized protein (DUF58 family)